MISLQLKDMSLNEKFMAIEMIWDDICRNSSNFPSPNWHENVLKERDLKIASGEDGLINWEIAKKQMRNSRK